MQTILKIYFIFYIGFVAGSLSERVKRFLIFPRQAPTRYQFIAGIGIPVDLEYESLTEGYVLKTEYWLPYNATVYRQNPFVPGYETQSEIPVEGRSKRSPLRWYIYDIIVNKLNSHGLNGQECMQKAICEAATIQFARDFDLYAGLAHIFFTPSSSLDADMSDSYNYKEAERHGRAGLSCDIYDCKVSIINWVSTIQHF